MKVWESKIISVWRFTSEGHTLKQHVSPSPPEPAPPASVPGKARGLRQRCAGQRVVVIRGCRARASCPGRSFVFNTCPQVYWIQGWSTNFDPRGSWALAVCHEECSFFFFFFLYRASTFSRRMWGLAWEQGSRSSLLTPAARTCPSPTPVHGELLHSLDSSIPVFYKNINLFCCFLFSRKLANKAWNLFTEVWCSVMFYLLRKHHKIIRTRCLLF